jgi:hypothetical protein
MIGEIVGGREKGEEGGGERQIERRRLGGREGGMERDGGRRERHKWRERGREYKMGGIERDSDIDCE